jgi:hypothetical protein
MLFLMEILPDIKMLSRSWYLASQNYKNYKADAEGVTEEIIIENCYSNSFFGRFKLQYLAELYRFL